MRKAIRHILSVAVIAMALTSLASAGSVGAAPEEKVEETGIEDGDTVVPMPLSLDAASAFIDLPRQDLDLLTKSMRQDMVLYMEADSVLKKLNVYMGESWIDRMTEDYMRVHLSDASELQIKILEYAPKGKKIAMTIYTVTADSKTADSTVKFYDDEMKELSASKYFTLPDPKSFYIFPKGEKVDKNAIFALMPFYTVEYNISEEGNTLSGRLTMSDYLTREDLAKVEKYLDVEKEWKWNGKRFTPAGK